MPKFLPYEQGSTEWLLARVGLLTASNMDAVTSVLKSGKPSEQRTKLLYNIVAERRSQMATPTFVTKSMERGNTEEPASRDRYEEVTGNLVSLVGLAIDDELEYWGASCDGLVGKDGCVEFKNPETATLIKYQVEGILPLQYRSQCLTQLAITGRKWCDFFAYDSRIKDEGNYFLIRFTPTEDEIREIREAARLFLAEVNALHSCLVPATAKNYDMDSDWPVSAPDKLAA